MKKLSIKLKIAIACSLLFMGAIAAVTALHIYFLKQKTRELLATQQESMVLVISKAIDDKFELRQASLDATAVTARSRFLNNEKALLAWADERSDVAALFDDFFVFNSDGVLVYDGQMLPARLGTKVGDRAYFKDTLATGKPQISSPYTGRQNKQPNIMITAPVQDASGKIVAVLGGQLNLLKPTLLGEISKAKIGKTGYFYLVTRDEQPVIVVHPNRERVMTPTSAKGVNPALDQALQGFEGTLEGNNSSGQAFISSFKRLSSTGWVLATTLPANEAYGAFEDTRQDIILAAVAISLLGAALVWLLVFRMMRPLAALHRHIALLRDQPTAGTQLDSVTDDEIGEVTREFNAMVKTRHEAEQAVEQLNEALTRQAAELKEANRELAEFSHTVSHDLRSPLRAVHGYSSALKEDMADKLSEEELHYLDAVIEGAQRMGRLIDCLLELSRVGRAAVNKGPVNMKAKAEAAFRTSCESREEEDKVQPQLQIDELPAAQADSSLIERVWQNLVSNAVKYSGRSEKPVVRISATQAEGETVYCIKDNGVGFNMKYYDKLFGVFQRLHGADEFPGTGVGLSIVAKVVTLHGGRVWATSEEGQGAAFFFSLPDAQPEGATE